MAGNFTDIDKSATQILEGNVENSRFGYSLALLDYNADGVNDLAVSAPSQGEIVWCIWIHWENYEFTTLAFIVYTRTHFSNILRGGGGKHSL